MFGRLDFYSLRAEVLPVYFCILPIAVLLAVAIPSSSFSKTALAGASGMLAIPLAFLFSQIGRSRGKHLEDDLWDGWGGSPTVRFLRHGNSEFNSETRRLIHDKLATLGLPIPSKEEQKVDPSAADEKFEACVADLRRRTRDSKEFRLVMTGLTGYGFWRNCLGIKWIGTTSSAISLLGVGLLFYFFSSFEQGELTASVVGVSGALSLGMLGFWGFMVREKVVHQAAKRYARFLLEAAMSLS